MIGLNYTTVDENPSEETVLYPNPTTGDIFITIPDIMLNEIKILGINGELKANINPLEVRINPNTLKMNLNGYSNGTYLIDIYGDNWHKTYKAALVK
ncbi:MAG: Secretion system C-terminal sorting domain [Bacteroidota bacterium]|nr:Secretion system C-terminal sorting domain [Bacteroidota bacterium]